MFLDRKESAFLAKPNQKGQTCANVLVVDDENFVLQFFEVIVKEEGHNFIKATSITESKKALQDRDIDLCVLDVRLPDGNGLDLLNWIRRQGINIPVIIITAFGSISEAVEAMKMGAFDFITKPFEEPRKVKTLLKNAINQAQLFREVATLRSQLRDQIFEGSLVGKSKKMLNIFELIRKAARVESNILIYGESGTGKELVAKAIHSLSNRHEEPFVAINCAALPETLLESSLFGYEKGAFTGASKTTKGFFEEAHTGTLLLDEIGDTPLSVQAKILRAVEESIIFHLGGTKPIPIDVRLIFSTNKDLRKEVQEHRFRGDLYYRINVINMTLPPLRERKEDIPILADYFLRKYCSKTGIQRRAFDVTAVSFLVNQEWPGNVRELENFVERVVALQGDANGNFSAKDLMQYRDAADFQEPEDLSVLDYKEYRRRFEKRYFENLITMSGGDLANVAAISGLHVATIYRKIKELNAKTPLEMDSGRRKRKQSDMGPEDMKDGRAES